MFENIFFKLFFFDIQVFYFKITYKKYKFF